MKALYFSKSLIFLISIFLVPTAYSEVDYNRSKICSDSTDYNQTTTDESDPNYPPPGESFFELDEDQSLLHKKSGALEPDADEIRKDLLVNDRLFSCDDNSEGQGTAQVIEIELQGLNCAVKYVYQYEYGNSEDPLGMFDIWPSYIGGFSCKIVGFRSQRNEINVELNRFYKSKRLTCGPSLLIGKKTGPKAFDKLAEFCRGF